MAIHYSDSLQSQVPCSLKPLTQAPLLGTTSSVTVSAPCDQHGQGSPGVPRSHLTQAQEKGYQLHPHRPGSRLPQASVPPSFQLTAGWGGRSIPLPWGPWRLLVQSHQE